MPRSRPQLSITLPKNFTYHIDEGKALKTPDAKSPQSPIRPPHATRPYRLKRRSRPAVSVLFSSETQPRASCDDTVMQSIEHVPAAFDSKRNLYTSSLTLGSASSDMQHVRELPHTPEPCRRPSIASWMNQPNMGESISRPLSRRSVLSDSSEESTGSLNSYPNGDGSCTSPESEAPPLKYLAIRQAKACERLRMTTDEAYKCITGVGKRTTTRWTLDMDQHLWSTYLLYLQDPTVTPFKMLPGVAPPLGVCYRVAREARKSWHPGRGKRPNSPSLQSSVAFQKSHTVDTGENTFKTPCAVSTEHSGGFTPTNQMPVLGFQLWPKSGSSTRRRLRYLCKNKPSIAPHYQRLLQTRSPSPLSSSPHSALCSQTRLSKVSSPQESSLKEFNTRDVQLSLTTSTADTMQPDGPLAQLADVHTSLDDGASPMFNEPPVPFASDISIPSELDTHLDNGSHACPPNVPALPRLGSPFGFHTWGPSQTRQRLRPRPPRTPVSEMGTIRPPLESPLELQRVSNRSSIPKRRARNQLEQDCTPRGCNFREITPEVLSSSPTGRLHRRVRSRGFSLGDLKRHPLQSLFDAPLQDEDGSVLQESHQHTKAQLSPPFLQPTTPQTDDAYTFDSPLSGISPQMTSISARRVPSVSLGAPIAGAYPSIQQTVEDS